MNYYEVAPNAIVRLGASTFTYASEHPVKVGSLVVISVGKKNLIGLIMKETAKPQYPVKAITEIIEATPLPQPLLKSLEWIAEYYNTPLATVVQAALPRGLTKKRRPPAGATTVNHRKRTNNVLTKDQSRAIDTITKSGSGTTILHGVTGSGKTLVYIELAKRALAEDRSAIILVPEIALTSQLVSEFSHHFPDILLTHSHQTEAERHLVWQQALKSTQPRIVIGPRSALFTPLANIGLIAIDEFHEPSYKQEQAPRYSASQLASILAKFHKAKVVLGSATPNVADYYRAEKSNRPIVTMNTPARQDTTAPNIQIVDMTKRENFSHHQFLSNQLIEALKSTLGRGEQSLVFHNRRGTASTTLCDKCGWQSGCPRCYVPLTLHSDKHKLRCHICSFESAVPTSCPSCHNANIIHKGLGTKRIEAELKKMFPDKNIARFDGDTASDDGVDRRYQELYSGDIDIIIGTQVIAKGLDLPHLRTVGIVQADAGLGLPDFSTPERTFQLLAQVIGRVGRSHHATNVVVQSYQPSNIAVQDGLTRNYQDFYERTLALRQHTNFPPFTHLLKLVCVYKTEKSAVQNSRKLAEILRQHASDQVEILGPTPAFYERIRDTYRWQLIIKSPNRQDLIELLKHLPPTHWQYELDPTSLL